MHRFDDWLELARIELVAGISATLPQVAGGVSAVIDPPSHLRRERPPLQAKRPNGIPPITRRASVSPTVLLPLNARLVRMSGERAGVN